MRLKQRSIAGKLKGKNIGGFLLLEAILAVTIFAVGVLVLGRCVSTCLAAERIKEEDGRARRALENRWAEVESGAVQLSNESSEDLLAPFLGMRMKTTRVAIERKNEKEEKIVGLFSVTLEVSWQSDGEEQSKSLIFYVYPRQ